MTESGNAETSEALETTSTETTASSAPSDPSTADDAGTSGDASGATTGNDSAPQAESDASGDGDGSDSGGAASSVGGSSEAGPPPLDVDPVCAAYGDHLQECDLGDASDAAEECHANLTNPANSPACTDANEDLFMCLSQVDCAAFERMPCFTEFVAIPATCFP